MLHQIFGTTPGRKALFTCLFGCFILFTGFVYTAEVPAPANKHEHELVLQGKQLWQQHNCSACHQIYGLGGYLGPDVTNVISAKGKGEVYARAIMQYGTATMPDYKLQATEVDALIAFLRHTDQTGKASRENFQADAYGQIHTTNSVKP